MNSRLLSELAAVTSSLKSCQPPGTHEPYWKWSSSTSVQSASSHSPAHSCFRALQVSPAGISSR